MSSVPEGRVTNPCTLAGERGNRPWRSSPSKSMPTYSSRVHGAGLALVRHGLRARPPRRLTRKHPVRGTKPGRAQPRNAPASTGVSSALPVDRRRQPLSTRTRLNGVTRAVRQVFSENFRYGIIANNLATHISFGEANNRQWRISTARARSGQPTRRGLCMRPRKPVEEADGCDCEPGVGTDTGRGRGARSNHPPGE